MPKPTIKPVPSHVSAQPQTQMRAPTWNERIAESVRSLVETAADQPLIRMADLLGLSDVRGVAEEMGQPNTGLKLGMMAEGPGKALKAPIKAYHGSPHDFDQFSLSKIGTGEGAQAYGHGLYFAESPAVAADYRRALSKAEDIEINGARLPADLADRLRKGHQSKTVRQVAQSVLSGDELIQAEKALDAFESGASMKTPGHTYEVSIHADPEDFLDWDAPLSQQPKVLGKLSAGDKSRRYMELQDALEQMQKSGKLDTPEWNAAVAESRQLRESAGGIAPTMTGEDLHRSLWADADAPVNRGRQSVLATEQLKAQGIPGIKYLDGASRSAGQGSRNYVVFDDQLISIVKKYGIAAALGSGAINQMQAQQLKDQGFE